MSSVLVILKFKNLFHKNNTGNNQTPVRLCQCGVPPE
jgi:hypothetical protein